MNEIPAAAKFEAALRKEPNELKRKMLLLGYLSKALEQAGGELFLVGGQAVETYTGGVFTTGDIDISTTKTAETEALLSDLGFSKEGMIWLSTRLGLAVHIVTDYPRRALRARTIEVGGYEVKVVGVEDLILDRLAAAKFWKSERDAEQARALLATFKDSIDYAYLKKIAREDSVEDVLQRVGKAARASHRPRKTLKS